MAMLFYVCFLVKTVLCLGTRKQFTLSKHFQNINFEYDLYSTLYYINMSVQRIASYKKRKLFDNIKEIY